MIDGYVKIADHRRHRRINFLSGNVCFNYKRIPTIYYFLSGSQQQQKSKMCIQHIQN